MRLDVIRHQLWVKTHWLILIWMAILMAGQTASAQVLFNDFETSVENDSWIGLQSVDSGMAFSGNYASVTGGNNIYGAGYEGPFPDEYQGENCWLIWKGWFAADSLGARPMLVLTIQNEEGLQLWRGLSPDPAQLLPGNWVFGADSVMIPHRYTDGTTIKAYLWNQTPGRIVWMDDLMIECKPLELPSFLPKWPSQPILNIPTDNKVLYTNSYYKIVQDQPAGTIRILDADGVSLVNDISWYRKSESNLLPGETGGTWQKVTIKRHNETTFITWKHANKEQKTTMTFACRENQQQIDVEVQLRYRKQQKVYRESIILNSALPVKKILRADRKQEEAPFQNEYWLDKQGVVFGDTAAAWSVYHVPGVSSLQLDTRNRQLWVNLDYDRDHPLFRYPLKEDTSNWIVDVSTSEPEKREQRVFNFTINTRAPENMVRIMKNPDGYLAAYLWTEHADWTNIRTHRASYYGDERIHHGEQATGGFVKYDIPVTKSVFYTNPDHVLNTDGSAGVINDEELSIMADTAYLSFLEDIHQRGSEICLHTPDHYTSTPEILDSSLSFMEDRFGSSTWIDHGNNNHQKNNREDLVCDATMADSPYYMLGRWADHGIRYLHNSYFEDVVSFEEWQWERSFHKPYPGFGAVWPKADYWTHPTITDDMVHWPSTSALFLQEGPLWDYFFNRAQLLRFVNDWGTEYNHSYPAWVTPEKGMWKYGPDSVMVAKQGFNQALEQMSDLREEGLLRLPTIPEYVGYRLATDQVVIKSNPAGYFRVINTGKENITGFSMAVKGRTVRVNGLIPDHRMAGEDLIFWFDLQAGEIVTVRVIP